MVRIIFESMIIIEMWDWPIFTFEIWEKTIFIFEIWESHYFIFEIWDWFIIWYDFRDWECVLISWYKEAKYFWDLRWGTMYIYTSTPLLIAVLLDYFIGCYWSHRLPLPTWQFMNYSQCGYCVGGIVIIEIRVIEFHGR